MVGMCTAGRALRSALSRHTAAWPVHASLASVGAEKYKIS